MLLTRDFLLHAMPYAKFYCAGVELDPKTNWDFYMANQEAKISFDSRSIEQNSIFIALKGETVNGHSFIEQAIKNGAIAVIVSQLDCLKKIDIADKLVVLVPDTYQTLIDLAKAWRAKLSCQVVGITGSIGKTSTKEILRSILNHTKINTYLSSKNQNTLLSLCTNILNIKTDCEVVVLEVGIDMPGQMAQKADILRPTIALITAISYSHTKYFKNLHNVMLEKRQIFKYLDDKGIGIIPGDYKPLSESCYPHPISRFGLKTKNNVQARMIKLSAQSPEQMYTNFILKWYGQKINVHFNSIHQGMLNNVLAASTIAYFLNIPSEVVKKGIEEYKSFENRFEPRKLNNFSGIVISDCYNANPDSMKAAITAFDLLKTDSKKIAVIGDMLELGAREKYWHRSIGQLLVKTSSINKVILVGNLVKHTASVLPDSMILAQATTWQDVENVLKKELTSGTSTLLVKASKGVALYELVDTIT